jgi:hypothetical protein
LRCWYTLTAHATSSTSHAAPRRPYITAIAVPTAHASSPCGCTADSARPGASSGARAQCSAAAAPLPSLLPRMPIYSTCKTVTTLPCDALRN